VTIGESVTMCSRSAVEPGVTLGEGVSIGAFSLVNVDCQAFKICAGSPARCPKHRSRKLVQFGETTRLAEES